MIVVDTSGLVAALDRASRAFENVRRVLEADPGPFVLSPFVLAEVDFLIFERFGVDAELAVLRQVAERAYDLAPFDASDVQAATEIIERYRDLGIGLADASVIVLAARHRTTRLLTLDERHFRTVRPLHGRYFRLLPLDA